MHYHRRFSNLLYDASLRPGSAAFAIMILLLFLVFLLVFMTFTALPVHGQSYKVIYKFTGGADGAILIAGLTMDASGNLYGTTCGAFCYHGLQQPRHRFQTVEDRLRLGLYHPLLFSRRR